MNFKFKFIKIGRLYHIAAFIKIGRLYHTAAKGTIVKLEIKFLISSEFFLNLILSKSDYLF